MNEAPCPNKMPAYQPSDPRHPTNKAQLVHAVALELQAQGYVPPGSVIPVALWNRMVKLLTGLTNDNRVSDFTQDMADYGMVRRHPRVGVEVLPVASLTLPLGWQTGAEQTSWPAQRPMDLDAMPAQ